CPSLPLPVSAAARLSLRPVSASAPFQPPPPVSYVGTAPLPVAAAGPEAVVSLAARAGSCSRSHARMPAKQFQAGAPAVRLTGSKATRGSSAGGPYEREVHGR